jgi:hypothetical protein
LDELRMSHLFLRILHDASPDVAVVVFRFIITSSSDQNKVVVVRDAFRCWKEVIVQLDKKKAITHAF